MNNRAMVLDVESTGISDDAQATELGWCDVHFDENGQLQPWGKAFVQRCKPEIPISFGSMAVSHIYEDELINEPSHRDVINHVVNDSVTYVIGHNIDYDMKVIGNAGQNRQYKRICSLAIAQACYPFDTDHKLLAMSHMLDYDFARKHAKNAHNAKFDVMFCVRILRIMCMNNNITNMEQLYQFSEFCRIPQYMRFGKHKGMAVDDVPLSYKRYLLDKGVEDPYVKIAFERSIAKNLADIAESNRVKAEQKRLAAEQKQAQNVIQNNQQPELLPQDIAPPYPDEVVTPQNSPEIAQVPPNNVDSVVTSTNPTQVDQNTSGGILEPVQSSTVAADSNSSDQSIENDGESNAHEVTSNPDKEAGKKELEEKTDEISQETNQETNDLMIDQTSQETIPSQEPDLLNDDVDVVEKEDLDKTSKSSKKEPKSSTDNKPKKKAKKKPSACTAPTADDIPPSFMPIEESFDDVSKIGTSSVPEQDDDFYNNPTSYDPMSKSSKADPLYKKNAPSTDPYGRISGQHQAASE